jgi:hypothetical protein
MSATKIMGATELGDLRVPGIVGVFNLVLGFSVSTCSMDLLV